MSKIEHNYLKEVILTRVDKRDHCRHMQWKREFLFTYLVPIATAKKCISYTPALKLSPTVYSLVFHFIQHFYFTSRL